MKMSAKSVTVVNQRHQLAWHSVSQCLHLYHIKVTILGCNMTWLWWPSPKYQEDLPLTCVCSQIRIFRITSYTIIEHACLFLLTCHECRCFCPDREHLSQYHRWPPTVKVLPKIIVHTQFWWIHGILRPLNWSIKRRGGQRPRLNP